VQMALAALAQLVRDGEAPEATAMVSPAHNIVTAHAAPTNTRRLPKTTPPSIGTNTNTVSMQALRRVSPDAAARSAKTMRVARFARTLQSSAIAVVVRGCRSALALAASGLRVYVQGDIDNEMPRRRANAPGPDTGG
jgi:hypothetical protein